MKLMELRNSALDVMRSKFPNMPEYVLVDFIYKNLKDDMASVDEYAERFKNLKWTQKTIVVTLDIFDADTANKLKRRKGGSENPDNVSNDAARHDTQKQMVSQAPSQEPIILITSPQGYELVEGWHRTIQSLENWPEGYKQAAWIGYK